MTTSRPLSSGTGNFRRLSIKIKSERCGFCRLPSMDSIGEGGAFLAGLRRAFSFSAKLPKIPLGRKMMKTTSSTP